MMTLLPEVGYRAETPRASSGSANLSRSSALSASTFPALPRFARSYRMSRSGSESSPDSLTRKGLSAGLCKEGRIYLHRWIEIYVHRLCGLS